MLMRYPVDAEILAAGEIAPDAHKAKGVIKVAQPQLATNHGVLPTGIDHIVTGNGAFKLGIQIAILDLHCLLCRERNGQIDLQNVTLLKDLHPLRFSMTEQNLIKAIPFNVHSRARIPKVLKGMRFGLALPVDHAAPFGNKALGQDLLGRADLVEIFPEIGDQAFAHNIARVALLLQQHHLPPLLRQRRSRHTACGAAANHDYITRLWNRHSLPFPHCIVRQRDSLYEPPVSLSY